MLEEVTLEKSVRDTIQSYLHGHPDYSLDLTFIPFAQELGPERNLVLAWNSDNINPAIPVFVNIFNKYVSAVTTS
ncbi:MAG: hypothetical protein LUD01_04325 [Clostridiales bacterium]|nr:hypothetical protein [Clostridiales bacterium]